MIALMLKAREAGTRCALCHEEGEDLYECPHCGGLTHRGCRIELGPTCPTLGCRGRVKLRRPRVAGAARPVYRTRLIAPPPRLTPEYLGGLMVGGCVGLSLAAVASGALAIVLVLLR